MTSSRGFAELLGDQQRRGEGHERSPFGCPGFCLASVPPNFMFRFVPALRLARQIDCGWPAFPGRPYSCRADSATYAASCPRPRLGHRYSSGFAARFQPALPIGTNLPPGRRSRIVEPGDGVSIVEGTRFLINELPVGKSACYGLFCNSRKALDNIRPALRDTRRVLCFWRGGSWIGALSSCIRLLRL